MNSEEGAMEYKKAHPVNIVESTSRFYILLLLPILRGLLFSGGNLYIWLKGAWFDILIIAAIILLGYIRWYFNMFRIDEDGLTIFRGIFLIKKEFIQYDRIASVAVEYPFYLKPLRAVRVQVDTDAGRKRRADFSMTMRRRDAEELLEKSKARLITGDQMTKSYSPKLFYIGVLSLISSNSFTGVIFASTLISQSGRLLGKEFEDLIMNNLTRLAEFLALGLPPAAAIIAYLLIGGWLISFIINIVRHKDFTVTRRDSSLLVEAGIITPRKISIDVNQINLVEIHQTLTTKILGFYSVFIHCTGYGKQKNTISVLIPAAEKHEATRNLELLLPEIPFVKKSIKPKLRNLSRFILVPSVLIASVAVAIWLCNRLFPSWGGLILFLGIMLEIPLVWYLLVRIFSFTHTGAGVRDGIFTIHYTKRFLFNRVSIPVEKVSKVVFSQTLFQRTTNCCDVIVYTYSEGTKKHVVQNLNYTEASTLLLPQIGETPVYDKEK
jgi:putative membrane protein